MTGSLVLLLAGRGEVRGDDRITAFVNAKGKIVFTNIAGHTAATPKIAPAPPTLAPRAVIHRAAQSSPLDNLIDTISARHGVNSSLVRAVIKVESNSDLRAVSNKGALGLMQLIPETGERFGVRDFFDPAQNIEGGVRYLRFLLQKFQGNLDLTLAAYNSGENRVARLGRIPRIPETQNYVRKVRAAYTWILGQARPAVASQRQATETVAAEPARQPAVAAPAAPNEASNPASSGIRRTVDQRGVARFSNVGP